VAAWRLGAGRARKEDPVSAVAGIVCRVTPGEEVAKGQPLLELHTEDPGRLAWARQALEGSIEIGDSPPAPVPIVLEVIK
jgi:thymidine phosphorylase